MSKAEGDQINEVVANDWSLEQQIFGTHHDSSGTNPTADCLTKPSMVFLFHGGCVALGGWWARVSDNLQRKPCRMIWTDRGRMAGGLSFQLSTP